MISLVVSFTSRVVVAYGLPELELVGFVKKKSGLNGLNIFDGRYIAKGFF